MLLNSRNLLKIVISTIVFCIVLSSLILVVSANGGTKSKQHTIENLQNEKEFKKLLKTKNNVLVLFTSSNKENGEVLKVFRDSSEQIKGLVC